MPDKPTPPRGPLTGPQRGKLVSATELDGREERVSRLPREVTQPGLGERAVPPLRDADEDESPTGLRSADKLATVLGQKNAEIARLNRRLAERGGPPAAVESEATPPSSSSKGRARAVKAAGGVLVAVLGAAGGAGGSEGLKALRGSWGEPVATRSQVDDLRADLTKARAETSDLREYLTAAYADEDGWRMLVTAYMCSQRQLLASGVTCPEVLSVVPVNPSPLTAAKPVPQLVIPGPLARKPEPRLPPKPR